METDATKKYYEDLFLKYPDVVNFTTFLEMLGGISECFGRKLLRDKIIKCFRIDKAYFIPKSYILDYVVSDDYQNYKCKLKHKI